MMISAGVGLFLVGFIGCAAAVRQNRTAFFSSQFQAINKKKTALKSIYK